MAHTEKAQEEFILLRAKGFSFDKISAEINVSKPTLIKWQLLFKEEIQNLEYFNFQSIVEQYKLTKRERIETFSKQLKKTLEEIEKRDLKETPLKDLLLLKNDCEEKLEKELKEVSLHTGERASPFEIEFGKEKLLPLC
jgi:predicted RND superfamily exporter protein